MSILYLHDAAAEAFVARTIAELELSDVETYLLPEGELADRLVPDTNAHLIVSGSVETLGRVLAFAAQHSMSVGILPMPDQTRLSAQLALPKKVSERFAIASALAERSVDMLFCNEIPVVEDVRIGENTLIEAYEFESQSLSLGARIPRWIDTWKRKTRLRHRRFTLRTAKDESLSLSAVGLVAMNHDNHSFIGHALSKEMGAADGQLALVALAPTSLFEFFVAYPIRLAWRRWRKETSLPASWGYLKSSRVEVASSEPLDVVIDDTQTLQTPVTLCIEPEALRLSVGEAFWDAQSTSRGTRDTIRLAGVPRGEDDRIDYFERGLPLFTHASREQYASLFGALRDETQLSWTFVI